jgi:hypothetical protein
MGDGDEKVCAWSVVGNKDIEIWSGARAESSHTRPLAPADIPPAHSRFLPPN